MCPRLAMSAVRCRSPNRVLAPQSTSTNLCRACGFRCPPLPCPAFQQGALSRAPKLTAAPWASPHAPRSRCVLVCVCVRVCVCVYHKCALARMHTHTRTHARVRAHAGTQTHARARAHSRNRRTLTRRPSHTQQPAITDSSLPTNPHTSTLHTPSTLTR